MKYKTIALFSWIAMFVGIVSGCSSTTAMPEYHPYVKSPDITIKEVCDEILNTPEEKIDIGKYALLLTKTVSPDLDVDYELKQLDDMANTVRPRLKGVTDPQKIVDILNNYFFKEMGFKSAKKEDPQTFGLIHYGRIRRSAHCATIGVLYLCLTGRLNLPVYGVGIPDHFFVRYDDGKARINIDTTYDSGKNISDEEYLKKFAPLLKDTNTAIKERMLKNLSRKEILGGYLLSGIVQEFTLGLNAKKDQKSYIRALEYTDYVIKLFPDWFNGYTYKGLYTTLKELDSVENAKEAIKQLRLACQLYPYDARTDILLASAYDSAKEYQECLKLIENVYQKYSIDTIKDVDKDTLLLTTLKEECLRHLQEDNKGSNNPSSAQPSDKK